jgi:hypothetical protein
MSNQIPGVPEGWELMAIRVPDKGEWFVGVDGKPCRAEHRCGQVWPIIRKIEKPARYRPFANAEEFKPHRDRWWRYNDSEDSERAQPPAAYSKIGPMGSNWAQAFSGRVFDDGTPFGVKIDE